MRTRQYFSLGDFGECLFTHLFLTKNGPKKTKNQAKYAKYLCFCVCDCAGTDILENGQKSTENGKNEHVIWKEREKTRPRRSQNYFPSTPLERARKNESNGILYGKYWIRERTNGARTKNII